MGSWLELGILGTLITGNLGTIILMGHPCFSKDLQHHKELF